MRIGVNWGSLDPELLTRLMDENSQRAEPLDAQQVMRQAVVESALSSARRAEELGLAHARIILSAKVSGVQDLIAIYRDLARRCDYPLPGSHRGRHGLKGIVASTAGMAVLRTRVSVTLSRLLTQTRRRSHQGCWWRRKSADHGLRLHRW